MREGSGFLILYIVSWCILYAYLQRKYRYFGAGSLIVLITTICAICSLVIYNNYDLNWTYQYSNLTLFPFVYLFVSEILFLSPLLRYNEGKIKYIDQPNIKLVIGLSSLFVGASLLQIPSILSNMLNGINILLASEDGGAELYSEIHSADIRYMKFGYIERITSIIVNVLGDISILFFFYLLSIGYEKKILIYGYVISIIISLLQPISMGLRTGVTMRILTILIAYVTMRKFLPKFIRRKARSIGIIVGGIVFFLFFMLTASRFGDREGGSSTYMLSYIGQANIYFNEYGLDANGIRNGDRTMNTFKSILGFSDTPEGVVATRKKYSNMKLSDANFSTYIGDFTLDFGPITVFFILLSWAAFMNVFVRIRGERIAFYNLFALYFVMCVGIQGIFYLFNYSFKGNYTILAFVIVYTILVLTRNKEKNERRNSNFCCHDNL